MTMDGVAMNRREEAGVVPIRSDRLFTQHSYWYFRTREGMDIGPFDSISEAVNGINGFVEFVQTTEPEVVTRITDYVTHAA
ncbi:MAG: DUF6316 family protein [Cellvibrionaceae bacterium]